MSNLFSKFEGNNGALYWFLVLGEWIQSNVEER